MALEISDVESEFACAGSGSQLAVANAESERAMQVGCKLYLDHRNMISCKARIDNNMMRTL